MAFLGEEIGQQRSDKLVGICAEQGFGALVGRQNLPLGVEHEHAVGCRVEDRFQFLYPVVFGVIIGTGTGAGIVVDGRLLSGPHAISGEWGHNSMPWHSPADGEPACYCGKRGCIETFLSGPGLAASYQRRFGVQCGSEEICRLARSGDQDARIVMDSYYDQLARALAQVINILDPDVIVLGGGMSNIDDIYVEVPARLGDYVFSDYFATPILPAEGGDASGVLGAALLWG